MVVVTAPSTATRCLLPNHGRRRCRLHRVVRRRYFGGCHQEKKIGLVEIETTVVGYILLLFFFLCTWLRAGGWLRGLTVAFGGMEMGGCLQVIQARCERGQRRNKIVFYSNQLRLPSSVRIQLRRFRSSLFTLFTFHGAAGNSLLPLFLRGYPPYISHL